MFASSNRKTDFFHFLFSPRTRDFWNADQREKLIQYQTGLGADQVIEVSDGLRRIGSVTVGMEVTTFDHGYQPVREVQHLDAAKIESSLPPELWPVFIPAHYFNNARSLVLPPEQPVLLESTVAEGELGDPFVVVPARTCCLLPGIAQVSPKRIERPSYEAVQLFFDQTELIRCAEGWFALMEGMHQLTRDLSHYEDETEQIYTRLPFDYATDLFNREIAHWGGVAGYIEQVKALSRES